jgi:hypothetical protein
MNRHLHAETPAAEIAYFYGSAGARLHVCAPLLELRIGDSPLQTVLYGGMRSVVVRRVLPEACAPIDVLPASIQLALIESDPAGWQMQQKRYYLCPFLDRGTTRHCFHSRSGEKPNERSSWRYCPHALYPHGCHPGIGLSSLGLTWQRFRAGERRGTHEPTCTVTPRTQH